MRQFKGNRMKNEEMKHAMRHMKHVPSERMAAESRVGRGFTPAVIVGGKVNGLSGTCLSDPQFFPFTEKTRTSSGKGRVRKFTFSPPFQKKEARRAKRALAGRIAVSMDGVASCRWTEDWVG